MKMSKKKCEKGWKWVKRGENPKMPYPPCGRSIKTSARGNNDAPSITGSLVWLDTQIVALRAHCAKGAPYAKHPPQFLGAHPHTDYERKRSAPQHTGFACKYPDVRNA